MIRVKLRNRFTTSLYVLMLISQSTIFQSCWEDFLSSCVKVSCSRTQHSDSAGVKSRASQYKALSTKSLRSVGLPLEIWKTVAQCDQLRKYYDPVQTVTAID